MDIGIDLGTTFSVIAVKGKLEMAPGYPPAEYLEEMDVTILPSANGNPTFPSVFWWQPADPEQGTPEQYVFGDAAKQLAEEGKAPIMFSKRSIGTNELLKLNGRDFTAKEVAERFLRHLKEWAETVTGQKVGRAVVTHPAYFKPNQREETLKAAQAAGLNVTSELLMMEPCAAALAYTVNDKRDPLRVMTYDLGGGTFDVAVMEKIEGVIQMKKFNGDHLLGGCNFDDAFVQWILDQLKAKGKNIPYDENNEEHRGRRARMLQVAESVKIRLAEQKTDKIAVPVQVDFLVDDKGQRVQFRGQINREQYAALIQDELRKTIQCCRSALDDAGMKVEDLNAILLVGGSTKGKWVVDAVAKEFGPVGEPYHPDLCVAAGAAICVAQLAPPPPTNDRVKLTLDYQSTSVLPEVAISGVICPSEGSDLTPEACRKLRLYLDTPGGDLLGPAEIAADGRFVFNKLALQDDGSPSHFKLTVKEENDELLSHEVTIVFSEGTPPPPPPVPVLPRPLFLKAERMVAMADEGDQLPVKCQVSLTRAFGGPTLPIPIYLEREEVGTVLVEDIPEEGGEGCKVVVDVEVTQNNEMRGKVLVYGVNGKTVVKEGSVRIEFPPIIIPELGDLLGKFDELKDRLENDIPNAAPQDRARLAGSGRALVRKIKKIIEGQSPDRQVLFERIKELEHIVNPPPEDMDPPRREFDDLVAECRESIAEDSERLKAYTAQVDRVETAGKEAYDTKNNRKWATANETLRRIRHNLDKPDGPTPPPPPKPTTTQLKLMAEREIQGLRAALNAAREARAREAGADRWTAPCEECERRIDNMAAEVKKIRDEADSDQAMAQVQSYLAPAEMLRKKIAKIQVGAHLEGGQVVRPQ
jgi:actin-like ATPase involved in cell morphogenesis